MARVLRLLRDPLAIYANSIVGCGRRLRAVIWKQWKRHQARYRELTRRGVPRAVAQSVAASSRGPWPLSQNYVVHRALPNAFFRSLGLPLLEAAADT